MHFITWSTILKVVLGNLRLGFIENFSQRLKFKTNYHKHVVIVRTPELLELAAKIFRVRPKGACHGMKTHVRF